MDPKQGAIPYVSVALSASDELRALDTEARLRWNAFLARGGGNSSSSAGAVAMGANSLAPYPLMLRLASGDRNEWREMYESVWYAVVVRAFMPAVFLFIAGKAVYGMCRWRKSRAQNPTASKVPFFIFLVMFIGASVEAAIVAAGGWFGSCTLPFEPERTLFLFPATMSVFNKYVCIHVCSVRACARVCTRSFRFVRRRAPEALLFFFSPGVV
jgi:hypothetical protein